MKKYFVFFTDLVTHLKDGIMSAADKKKLDGIAEKANNYTHPETSGNRHIPSGGASGKILRWSEDGAAEWGDDKDTTYSDATASTAGLMSAADKKKLDGIAEKANNYTHPETSGNRHIPSGGASGKILRWSEDGKAVWGDDRDTTYSNATQSASGLMSAADKKKLDGVAEGANKTTVDAALSKTSANPVQNKVIAAELESIKKSGSDGKTTVASAITAMGVATAADAAFVTMADNIKKISTGVDTADATAAAAEILTGKTAYVNEAKVTGTMPDQGAKTAALDCGGSYTIPAGYHNGSGKVTANSLASQTVATATSGEILTGETAYVNGQKVTGTMPDQGARTAALDCGGSYTIPAGYHNGSGKVTVNSLASQTAATLAGSGQLRKGVTAFSNGTKYTGSMAELAAAAYTPGTADQEIAAGQFLAGKQTIRGDAKLVAGNIKSGVTIFGVSGTYGSDIPWLNINSSVAASLSDGIYQIIYSDLWGKNLFYFSNGAYYLMIIEPASGGTSAYLRWYPLKGVKPDSIELVDYQSYAMGGNAPILKSSSPFSIGIGEINRVA